MNFRRQRPPFTSRAARGARSFRRGQWAETLCRWLLRLKGYRILARNYRSRAGEIDLIVKRGNVLAAVEVKARSSREAAGESVLGRQRVRIARVLENYLALHPGLQDLQLRFDVVLVAPSRLPLHVPDAWRPGS